MSLANIESRRELKGLVDNQSSRATYKKAVKALVKDYTSVEFVDAMRNKYQDSIVKTQETLVSFMDIFSDMGLKSIEDYYNYPKPVGKNQDWNLYNAAQTVFRLQLRIEALQVDADQFKTNTNTMLKVLVDMFAKTDRDTVILNSLVNKVARVWDCPVDSAAIHLSMWCETGLMDYSVTTNEATGAREHMYKLNLNVDEVRSVYLNTSDRKLRFGEVDSVEGRDILIKKKYPYEFIIEANEAQEAIDHINDCRMKLVLPEEKLIDVAKRKVFGNDCSENVKLSEPWHLRVLAQATGHYNLIHKLGNEFRVTHKADGVFRLYDSEDFFSPQQGEFIREYLEFSEGEVLNDIGRRWIKLKIAGQNGYGKVTESVALQAFADHWDEWSNIDKNTHLFDILNSEEETGYMLELDAQSQNYGIYGLCTGDTSLTDMAGYHPLQRLDIREISATIMNSKLGTVMWTKSLLKPSIMTKAYSAKYKTLMFGSGYDEANGEVKQKGRAIPLMSVSDKSKEDTWAAFSETMEAVVPRVLRVMEDIEEKAKRNNNDVVEWIMPDGIKCQIAMQEIVETELCWVDANGKMHKAKHHSRVMNPKAGVTAHAPRYIQSIDAYMLRLVAKMLKALGIAFTAVHDGFITHPNYGDILCECYRKASVIVWEKNLLSNIVNQTMNCKVNYQAKGTMNKEYIENSHYTLWI